MRNKIGDILVIAIVVFLVLLFVYLFSSKSKVDERRQWLIARRDRLKKVIDKKEQLVTKVQKLRNIIFKISIIVTVALMLILFFVAGKIGIIPLTISGFGDALMLYTFFSNTLSLLIFNKLISLNEMGAYLKQRVENYIYCYLGKESLILSLIDNRIELTTIECEIQQIDSNSSSSTEQSLAQLGSS